MDDIRDHALDVAVPLSIVHDSVLGSALAMGIVGLKDASMSLTLTTNDATHLRIAK